MFPLLFKIEYPTTILTFSILFPKVWKSEDLQCERNYRCSLPSSEVGFNVPLSVKGSRKSF